MLELKNYSYNYRIARLMELLYNYNYRIARMINNLTIKLQKYNYIDIITRIRTRIRTL